MKSHIYEMLEAFFDDTMINIAKKFNYSEDNIIILESDEKKLKDYYPETYNNLKSCSHNRDARSMMEYAQDIICSWIFEDYLLLNLKLNGFEIELSGADRNRKLLKSNKVSAASDYIIKYNNKKGYIELANDYKGYWKKYKKCDLRDEKFVHIRNMLNNNDFSYLLGIDFVNKEFFIIDISDENLDYKYSEFHWAYRKPAYTISLKDVQYYNFDFNKIIKIIIEKIEGSK